MSAFKTAGALGLISIALSCSESVKQEIEPQKTAVKVEQPRPVKKSAKPQPKPGVCQTFAGGEFPAAFTSGCLGGKCYRRKCGAAQMRLKPGGSARISYNCRDGVNARWQKSGAQIVVTGTGDADFYCSERCKSDQECLDECYQNNIDDVGYKTVKHKFRYRLRLTGDSKIAIVNEHFDMHPADAQIPKDSYFHERNFKCLYELE